VIRKSSAFWNTAQRSPLKAKEHVTSNFSVEELDMQEANPNMSHLSVALV
jgi:hypothetical protein